MATFTTFGAANWSPSISCAEDSPAPISARPESEPGSQTPTARQLAAAFGLNSPVSLGNFDPDTCLLRTSQASLFQEQCQGWSETWPASGMWDAGAVYELQSSELPIFESASSLWPTTRATSGGGNRSAYPGAPCRPGLSETANNREKCVDLAGCGQGDEGKTSEWSNRWPTARSEDGESCGNHPGATDSLTGAAKLWPTPRAITGGAESAERKQESGGGDLQAEAQLWATPNAHDATGARGKGFELTDCHYKPHDLVAQTDNWKTPHGMSNRDFRGKVGGCGGGEFAKQANNWSASESTPVADVEERSTLSGKSPGTRFMKSCPLFHAPGADITATERSPTISPTEEREILTNQTGQETTIWQTPTSRLGQASQTHRSGKRTGELLLTGQANQWPTPNANPAAPNMSTNRGDGHRRRLTDQCLESRAQTMFPTPSSRDYRTPNAEPYENRGGGSKGEQLPNFVEHYCDSLQAPPIHDGPPSSPSGPILLRRLNPRFVEWLMGFPIGWTEP